MARMSLLSISLLFFSTTISCFGMGGSSGHSTLPSAHFRELERGEKSFKATIQAHDSHMKLHDLSFAGKTSIAQIRIEDVIPVREDFKFENYKEISVIDGSYQSKRYPNDGAFVLTESTSREGKGVRHLFPQNVSISGKMGNRGLTLFLRDVQKITFE